MTTTVTAPSCTCRHHLPTARETSLLATLQEMEQAAAEATGRQYDLISDRMNRLEGDAHRLQRDRLKRANKACPAAGATIWAKAV